MSALSSLALVSGLMVVRAQNPVHAVFSFSSKSFARLRADFYTTSSLASSLYRSDSRLLK